MMAENETREQEILWQASYLLEEEEIKKSVDYYLVKLGRVKWILRIIVLGILTAFFGATIFLYSQQAGGEIVLTGISLLALIAVILEPSLLAKKTVKEAMENRKKTVMKGTEEGILFKAGKEYHLFKWDEIIVGEMEDMFLLRLPTGLLVPAPFGHLDEAATAGLKEHATPEDILKKSIKGK